MRLRILQDSLKRTIDSGHPYKVFVSKFGVADHVHLLVVIQNITKLPDLALASSVAYRGVSPAPHQVKVHLLLDPVFDETVETDG